MEVLDSTHKLFNQQSLFSSLPIGNDIPIKGEWRPFRVPMQRLCKSYYTRKKEIAMEQHRLLLNAAASQDGNSYCTIADNLLYHLDDAGRLRWIKMKKPPKYKGYGIKQHNKIIMFNSLEEMLQALNMRLMATSYSSPNSENGSSGEKATWKYRYFAMVKRRILIDLAEIIEPEQWGPFNTYLHVYLKNTFLRLTETDSDDKSIVGFFPENSDEPSVVCFNTGLLSNKVEPVFALLTPNKYRQGENEAFYLTEFKTSGQLQNKFLMQKLNADPVPTYLLPLRAKYYEDPSLLFYDHRIPIEKDYNKIDWDFLLFKKNIKRLPEIYRHLSDEELLTRIHAALSVAEIKAQYNPRCVVPQYYWDERTEHGQLQLLLPVNLQGKKTGEIDCAVALVLHEERTMNGIMRSYKPTTLVSLEIAFNNSRLLQKVDQAWLISGLEYSNLILEDDGSVADGDTEQPPTPATPPAAPATSPGYLNYLQYKQKPNFQVLPTAVMGNGNNNHESNNSSFGLSYFQNQNQNQQSQLCKFFQKGYCKNGNNCHFLHA